MASKTVLDYVLNTIFERAKGLWLDPSCFYTPETLGFTDLALRSFQTQTVYAPQKIRNLLRDRQYRLLHEFLVESWRGPEVPLPEQALNTFVEQWDLFYPNLSVSAFEPLLDSFRTTFRVDWEVLRDLVVSPAVQGIPVLAFSNSLPELAKKLARVGVPLWNLGGRTWGGLRWVHERKVQHIYPHLKKDAVKTGLAMTTVTLLWFNPILPGVVGGLLVG